MVVVYLFLFDFNFVTDEMYVLSTRRNRISIQLVGKDKIQEKLNHFQDLTSVSISYMGVSSTGPLHEIYAALPSKTSYY